MSNVLLEFRDIYTSFKRRRGFLKFEKYYVHKGISFKVYESETLGILGRNGAGKSTLLKLMSGLILPDNGEIVNNGVRVNLLSLQAGFDQELNGVENIFLSGMFLGFSYKEVESKIDDIVEFSELEEFIKYPIKTYSSGMKARLGFSIAMNLKPDVVLLDEVLGVGDAEFRKKSSDYMRKKINSKQTVVLVSHNKMMIKNLCDRVIWIENGVIKAEGDPKLIVEEYEKYIINNKVEK